jgi:P27 family predicted phage terminase small subunit
MPKGRRPLPTAIKNLRGNPGKRKPNENEPKPIVGDPEMPEGLSDAAKAEWCAMIPHLLAMRVLTPVDRAALAGYCYTYDIWMRASVDIREFGVLLKAPVMGRKGTPEEDSVIAWITKKNPAVAIANEALKTMKSYLTEFGMTPSSRTKISTPKDEAEDQFAKWLQTKADRNAQSSGKPN